MKKLLSLSVFIFSFMYAFSVFAQEKLLIQYFTVEGPSEYAYLQTSLPNIIASRLGNANIVIIPTPKALPAPADVYKELAVQYVLSGSVVVLGDTLSVDIRLDSATGKTYRYPLSTTLNTLLADITATIPKIQKDILGKENVEHIFADSLPKSTFKPITKEAWNRSAMLPLDPRGIRITDLDADGIQEIVILGANELIIYTWEKGVLVEQVKKKFPIRVDAKYLAVAPVQGGKEQAILITTMISNRSPYSYIMSYSKGKLTELQSGVNYLFGAYYDATVKQTIPILQSVEPYPAGFFQSPIYSFSLEGKKIVKGKRISVPEYGNVFSFTTIPTEAGVRTLVLRPTDYIAYYKPNKKQPIYSTANRYSSTTYFFSLIPEELLNAGSRPEQELSYLPTHFVTMPRANNDVFLFASFATQRGMFTTAYRSYSSYTIQALTFTDTSSMVVWESPLISATVADFDIADIDNDGVQDLFVLTGLPPASTPTFKQKQAHILNMPLLTQ